MTTQDLPLHIQESKAEKALEEGREGRSLPQALEEIERQEIARALQKSLLGPDPGR